MGEAPPSERQYWIAEMDAATSAADKVREGAEQSMRSRYSSHSTRSTSAPLIVAVEDDGVVQCQRTIQRNQIVGQDGPNPPHRKKRKRYNAYMAPMLLLY